MGGNHGWTRVDTDGEETRIARIGTNGKRAKGLPRSVAFGMAFHRPDCVADGVGETTKHTKNTKKGELEDAIS